MENAELIALLTPVRDALNAALAKLAPPVIESKPQPQPEPVVKVPGLRFYYYPGTFLKLPDFAALSPALIGVLAVPGPVVPNGRADYYAIRLVGFLTVTEDAEYTFFLNSDDGSRLTIGDKLVIDNDGGHAAKEVAGKITLRKGTAYPIVIDYFDHTGDQVLALRYSTAKMAKTLVPATAYSCLPLPVVAPVPEAEKPKPPTKPLSDFTAEPLQ